ncbi:MAG: DUF1573 domain-containing protein [Planctomycetes bacterium]|nr:DUF1573 domain-containing protein [Planctomycetota bacterium]
MKTSAIPRWLAGGLISTLVFFGCSPTDESERPDDWAGPVLEYTPTEVDFGECFSGQLQVAEVVYRNAGKAPLVIEDVQAECGCSKPELSAFELLPGAEGLMTIRFQPPFPGQIQKHIRLFTNDPFRREAVVTLHAKGLGPARLEPSVVRLPETLPREGFRQRLELEIPASKSLTAVHFEISSPWMKVVPLGPIAGQRASFELQVEELPGPIGLREMIPVQVTAQGATGQPSALPVPFGLQVIGEARPLAWVEPAVASCGVVAGQERRVDLTVHGEGTSSTVTTVRIDGVPGATIERRDGGFELKIPATGPPGRFAGRAFFMMATGDSLVVPILGYRAG